MALNQRLPGLCLDVWLSASGSWQSSSVSLTSLVYRKVTPVNIQKCSGTFEGLTGRKGGFDKAGACTNVVALVDITCSVEGSV